MLTEKQDTVQEQKWIKYDGRIFGVAMPAQLLGSELSEYCVFVNILLKLLFLLKLADDILNRI